MMMTSSTAGTRMKIDIDYTVEQCIRWCPAYKSSKYKIVRLAEHLCYFHKQKHVLRKDITDWLTQTYGEDSFTLKNYKIYPAPGSKAYIMLPFEKESDLVLYKLVWN